MLQFGFGQKGQLRELEQVEVDLGSPKLSSQSIDEELLYREFVKTEFKGFLQIHFSNYNLDTNLKDETVFELDDLLLIENDTYTLKKYKSYNFINAINEQPN